MAFVGWVERSDTHQLRYPVMGIAGSTHPTQRRYEVEHEYYNN